MKKKKYVVRLTGAGDGEPASFRGWTEQQQITNKKRKNVITAVLGDGFSSIFE